MSEHSDSLNMAYLFRATIPFRNCALSPNLGDTCRSLCSNNLPALPQSIPSLFEGAF